MITCLKCQAQNLQGLTRCRQCGDSLLTDNKTSNGTNGTTKASALLMLDPDLPLPNNKMQRPVSDEMLPFELDASANDPLGDVFTSAAPIEQNDTDKESRPRSAKQRHTARREQKTRTWKPRKPRLEDSDDELLSADPTIATLQQRLVQLQSSEPQSSDKIPNKRHNKNSLAAAPTQTNAPNARLPTPRAMPVFTPNQRKPTKLTQPITATMPSPFKDVPTDPGLPNSAVKASPTTVRPPSGPIAIPPPIPNEARASRPTTNRGLARHRHPSGEQTPSSERPSGETAINIPVNSPTSSISDGVQPTMSGLRLAFLSPNGQISQIVPIKTGRSIIGREDGDILLNNDPTVSPWHAQLTVSKNGVFLKDMNTPNGIFLRQTGNHHLQDKDTFILGQHTFVFRNSWDTPPSTSPPLLGTQGYDTPERIILIREGGDPLGVYLLDNPLTIGRNKGDVSFPKDTHMSSEHAIVRRGIDQCTLTDLSHHQQGIYIQIRGEVEISDGQSFQIGRTRFRLVR